MTTFKDMLARVKSEIREISVEDTHQRWRDEDGAVLIDVRQKDEFDDGHIEGSRPIPRGLLELRIEDLVTDRSQPIILYCAGGTRSALAADALQRLGYENVESMAGGFSAWKQKGYPVHIQRPLSAEQRQRYSRHLIIPEVGEEGQRKLLDARVLLIGAGGLGSPAALYLAAAGVGHISILDSDVVDRSNLQRQIVHTDERVGVSKVESARQTLLALNPEIDVKAIEARLTSDNVDEIFAGHDVILDGGDNFPTRYLVNDASVHHDIPVVHGSVFRFEGQVTTFIPRQGPCYRCLYPEPPPPELAPSCQEAGVLGVLPGVIGLLQAVEVIKLIIGAGEPLAGRLLCYDALKNGFRELKLRRDPSCAVCADDARWEGYIDYDFFCRVGA